MKTGILEAGEILRLSFWKTAAFMPKEISRQSILSIRMCHAEIT